MKQLFTRSKIFIFVFALILSASALFAQKTIYIDPTNAGDTQADGSIEHPLSSWRYANFGTSGTTYLQKCGTIDTIKAIEYYASNLTFGSYSTGDKPKIFCQTKSGEHAFKGYSKSNITFRNLDISTDNGVSCIYFNANCRGGIVDSCVLHGASWGIRITSGGNSNHLIQNTEIYDIKDDGIFVQDASDIEIANCYIHHVNQNWQPPSTPESNAAGDGIQFDRTTEWYVHHNVIDRSDNGNKFCFISNNPNQSDCVVEHNTFIGPRNTSSGGACLYFGDGSNLIVRYNIFKDTDLAGIYYHTEYMSIYGNIFYNLDSGIYSGTSTTCTAYHNVFKNVGSPIRGTNMIVKNNIFDTDAAHPNPFRVTKLQESHNHYNYWTEGEQGTVGDPLFVDAENGDFHLQSGSPCIDAGTDVGIAEDMDGVSMPQGNHPDIGAFELPGGLGVTAENIVPATFSLRQNYPNPFNSRTAIEYTVGDSPHQLTDAFVTLKIYSITGQLVSTIVNEQQTNGRHTVQFDGSSLPSGTYVYELQIWNSKTRIFADAKTFALLK